MVLIMLDVDGVLNATFTKERLYGFVFVTESKLDLLKQLIDRTGARVVLTSTWRQGWADLDAGLKDTIDVKLFIGLRDKLLEHGIELMDYTPITNGAMNHRGDEIEAWMKAWKGEPIESIVILDDLNGRYLRPYANRLIRTSIAKGLTQRHVDLAVQMLKKPLDKEKEKDDAPIVLVHYEDAVDGDLELCEMLEDTLEEKDVCFHCNRKLSAGENVVLLLAMDDGSEYILCPECAKKACVPA